MTVGLSPSSKAGSSGKSSLEYVTSLIAPESRPIAPSIFHQSLPIPTDFTSNKPGKFIYAKPYIFTTTSICRQFIPTTAFLVLNHALSSSYVRMSFPKDCSVLLCSLAVLDPRVGHTMDVLPPFIYSLSSVILIDSSTVSPVHDLMLSIQAVRGLPRLRTPVIVPCIISFTLFPHCVTIVDLC